MTPYPPADAYLSNVTPIARKRAIHAHAHPQPQPRPHPSALPLHVLAHQAGASPDTVEAAQEVDKLDLSDVDPADRALERRQRDARQHELSTNLADAIRRSVP